MTETVSVNKPKVLPRFQIEDISKGTNTVICGKRLSGKSQLTVAIIQSRKDADIAIFSSKYVASSYKKFVPSDCIYDRYDPKILKRLLDKQLQQGPDKELVIAFDDVAVNGNLWKDQYIRDIIRYGSSLGITAIFSIQFAGQLDDMFKRNIDYVFCFRDNVIADQKLLHSEFASMFPTFSEFKTRLDDCLAEPYRSLVFDLKTPRKDPKQSVFWYKAPDQLKKHVPQEKKDGTTMYTRLMRFFDTLR